MKILVTGFEPFGGETVNPAYEAVKLLPDNINGAEIIKALLPTLYDKCADVLKEMIGRLNPDAVVCVGQAGRRADISIEKVAINLDDASSADNGGVLRQDHTIIEGGPAAYFSTLPVKEMVSNIKAHGVPASVSYSAGAFVCNHIMYRLLSITESEYPGIKAGFIHVPYDTSQVTGKQGGIASMPVEYIAKGLGYAIEVLL